MALVQIMEPRSIGEAVCNLIGTANKISLTRKKKKSLRRVGTRVHAILASPVITRYRWRPLVALSLRIELVVLT
jgi:hypothetical protein